VVVLTRRDKTHHDHLKVGAAQNHDRGPLADCSDSSAVCSDGDSLQAATVTGSVADDDTATLNVPI
jgi:hypothetical protein